MWFIGKDIELFYAGIAGLFNEVFAQASVICFLILILALFIKAHYHYKFREAVPTRFHRQRREVAFAPGDGKPPIIVPWENVAAWGRKRRGQRNTVYSASMAWG